MSEVIVVTSGKGGVGKTTTSANIGTGLAALGAKVVLIDTDIGLRNLDVVMGLENRIVYNLVDVIEGTCRIKQALIKDKRYPGLYLMPSAQARDKSAVTPGQMIKMISFLKEQFEALGCVVVATDDGSVGVSGTVVDAMREQEITGDVIYACGPKPMLAAVKQYAQEQGIKCYISMEERMACGVGACLGCVCQTKDVDEHSHVHNTRVCKDGPVFLAEEVEL